MTTDTSTHVVTIHRDTDPQNPREDCNTGTMVMFHKRYSLGDTDHGFRSSDYHSWDELEADILRQNPNAIILPVFMYDHSGLAFSTSPFSCQWDSGQVGFIFASLESVRDALGVKRVTRKLREQVEGHLKSELKTYDSFISGDYYGYTVEDADGEEIESCWGFCGSDPIENGMLDHLGEEYRERLVAASDDIH